MNPRQLQKFPSCINHATEGDSADYADECSGRLGKGFADNFSFGNQPIIKVVTVLTATLLIY
jgi:hypothetical protein